LKNTKKIVKNNSKYKISRESIPISNQKKTKQITSRLFSCTDEQSTDEDTSDEQAEILDEMSQTLEKLLRENASIPVSHEV